MILDNVTVSFGASDLLVKLPIERHGKNLESLLSEVASLG